MVGVPLVQRIGLNSIKPAARGASSSGARWNSILDKSESRFHLCSNEVW